MSLMPCCVVVPIYKETLDEMERFSLDYSLAQLSGHDVVFIAPESLQAGFYENTHASVPIKRYPDAFFSSIQGYNRLLLDAGFYEDFGARYAYILILQTDAIVLRDALDAWCGRAYDYVGAPWPGGIEVFVNLDRFDGDRGRSVRVHVGNGGLSLRRNAACAALLREFPQTTAMFLESGSSEDLFFAIMGSLSSAFRVPDESMASLFSLELQPEHYIASNQGALPMGGHAWWRYNHPLWVALLQRPPPVVYPATPPGVPVLSSR